MVSAEGGRKKEKKREKKNLESCALLFLGSSVLSVARGQRIARAIRRLRAISSSAGDSFSPRGEKERGDAPYRAIRISPPAGRYADCRYQAVLLKSTIGDRFRLVLAEGGRKKKREKNLVPPRVALPRFPRAICRPRAIPSPRA
ncbi:hypothetical protein BHM03_00000677 [Ensete ventricosum]|nr:hypothetical protein BHM03_00000677 [Ensete ventricosum]